MIMIEMIESVIEKLFVEGPIIDNKVDVFLQSLIDALQENSRLNTYTKKNVNNKTSNKKYHP